MDNDITKHILWLWFLFNLLLIVSFFYVVCFETRSFYSMYELIWQQIRSLSCRSRLLLILAHAHLIHQEALLFKFSRYAYRETHHVMGPASGTAPDFPKSGPHMQFFFPSNTSAKASSNYFWDLNTNTPPWTSRNPYYLTRFPEQIPLAFFISFGRFLTVPQRGKGVRNTIEQITQFPWESLRRRAT